LVLTPQELELVRRIDLREDLLPGEDARAIYPANHDPILRLLKSLSERNAIPKHRLALWTDPRLKPEHLRGSHQEVFARNGAVGDDAYTHPHFKPYLRYFLFGADLPQGAIQEFERQVGDIRGFSGSDILALTKKTREIVRTYDLRDRKYATEFQKLALDVGLSIDNAESVRTAAVEAARR
jgi:hypothetical protein